MPVPVPGPPALTACGTNTAPEPRLFAFLLSLAAYAADPVPTGRIEAVVVYPDRASVTRLVEVPVIAGVNAITFSDLPPTLDERTIQAEGEGVEGSRLLGIDVVSRELAEDRRARVAELSSRIEQLRDQIRADDDAVAAARTELTFLESVRAAASTQTSNQLLFADKTPAQASSVAELLRTRVPEVQARLRTAEFAARDKRAQLSALERELSTTQGAAQWARRDVVVEIESPAAGTATVRLTYVLPGASWAPSYDVRARPEASKVDMTMSALVVQTSGEDWTGVKLSLSTARPSAGTTPPELSPFWLQMPQPVYSSYDYDAGAMAPSAYDDAEMLEEESEKKAEAPAPPPPPAPMAVQVATVTERAVATSFDVPSVTTIPGDGTRKKVRVTEVGLPVAFVHVAVPRYDEAAWLVAAGTWEQNWPLLAGEVSSFLDDAFVGTAWLPGAGTGQEVELAFGVDDAVEVDKTLVTDRTSTADWMGKVTRELSWRYEVRNGRKTPIHLEIRDRIPQSADERWKVKYLGDPPEEMEGEGLVTFVRPMEGGATTTVNFGYQVRYPRRRPPGWIE